MNWLLDILDRLRAAYRARRASQAMADLQKGKDILDQAEREEAEMRAAADAAAGQAVKAEQIETYAETAYERYGDAVGWLAVSGYPMPRWPDLTPRIRSAWAEAVRGALGLPPGVAPGSLAPPPAPERS